MPKRQCPFDLNFLPQMKIHLGQKEYDMKHEENMTKIHDKTLQLLFNRSKEVYKLKGNTMRIKSTLDKAGLENNCCSENVSDYCSLCNDLNVAVNKCSFCDKRICQMCSAICKKCSQIFCVAHSFKLYDQNDDCICLNC